MRFEEYGNTGEGACLQERPQWVIRLSKEQAQQYTIQNVLGGEDGWNPQR